jgi:hypothetical protein
MPDICTRRKGTIKYGNDTAVIEAGDVTVYIAITSKELRTMYNWGRGGKLGKCEVTVYHKVAPDAV